MHVWFLSMHSFELRYMIDVVAERAELITL
jgi:hypothetical protein